MNAASGAVKNAYASGALPSGFAGGIFIGVAAASAGAGITSAAATVPTTAKKSFRETLSDMAGPPASASYEELTESFADAQLGVREVDDRLLTTPRGQIAARSLLT